MIFTNDLIFDLRSMNLKWSFKGEDQDQKKDLDLWSRSQKKWSYTTLVRKRPSWTGPRRLRRSRTSSARSLLPPSLPPQIVNLFMRARTKHWWRRRQFLGGAERGRGRLGEEGSNSYASHRAGEAVNPSHWSHSIARSFSLSLSLCSLAKYAFSIIFVRYRLTERPWSLQSNPLDDAPFGPTKH